MILACQELCKSYNDKCILNNISFHIEENEKAAIIGINGAGKSTLLKIIMGQETADDGQVIIAKDKTIGYLSQHQDFEFSRSIYEEMLDVKKDVIALEARIRQTEQEMKHAKGAALDTLMDSYTRMNHEFEQANGYAYQSEIIGVLKGLGFKEEDFDKTVGHLSGGQKTRVALGRLLLTKPDIIILDEPTNHLDMDSITWLESYLANYRGSVLIVSHDRYFLDRIVTKIISIELTHGTVFHGNYSFYAAKNEEIRANRYKAYLNQQKEIAHQEAVIEKLKSFNREKSIKRAESREKMLDKIERLEKPKELHDAMRLSLEPEVESGNDVLSVVGLSKSFGTKTLFTDIGLEVKRGEHVALIGANGTGKTTILKIINRLIPRDSGTVNLGSRVQIGYYDQEHQVLSPEKTIFDEISDAYPKLTNTRIRNLLASFLFTGEDVFKQIKDLSGGERGRVSLAKLMLSSANFLILDEPTNHLDITSKEILENALQNYSGTVLYVSHDRYFINRTATRIVELVGVPEQSPDSHGDWQLLNFPGNFDNYLEKRQLPVYQAAYQWRAGEQTGSHQHYFSNSDKNDGSTPAVPAKSAAKQDWETGKKQQARERKRQNDIKKAEDMIASLEAKIAELEAEMQKPENATNASGLTQLAIEQEELNSRLTEQYEIWEQLCEEAEVE
ncbi:MAG: ABC-F family ATP-binding cassette domain-containing protein [Lachnospiraceae bacterium]|nr:ABC-F family ATP-binding cassette domain-containing protein [Lachnospiraceae bacterium]